MQSSRTPEKRQSLQEAEKKQSLREPVEMPIELFDKFDRTNIKDAWGVFRTPALHDLIGNKKLVAIPNIEEANAFDATAVHKVESVKLPETYEYFVERKSEDGRLTKSIYVRVEEPKYIKTDLSLHEKVQLIVDPYVEGIEPFKQLLIVTDVIVAKKVFVVAMNGRDQRGRIKRMYEGPIPLAFKAVMVTVAKTGLITKLEELNIVEYDDWERYNPARNIPDVCTMAYKMMAFDESKGGTSSSSSSNSEESASSEGKSGKSGSEEKVDESSSSEKDEIPSENEWDTEWEESGDNDDDDEVFEQNTTQD